MFSFLQGRKVQHKDRRRGKSTEGRKPLACKGVASPVLIHVRIQDCAEAVSVHIPGVHNGKAQAWQRHESCT
jgi:hypothetical protein